MFNPPELWECGGAGGGLQGGPAGTPILQVCKTCSGAYNGTTNICTLHTWRHGTSEFASHDQSFTDNTSVVRGQGLWWWFLFNAPNHSDLHDIPIHLLVFLCRPMIEMTIPSVLDHSSAPGCHVVSLFIQFTPYLLEGRRAWTDEDRERFADTGT